MLKRYLCIFAVAAATWVAASAALAAESNFELRDGDRVVLLGNTLIEREQQYGYVEAVLTARYPDRNITFRNLGWSGDDVWATAHAVFEFNDRAKGYQRLIEHVQAIKPTVIVLGYGGNEAFAGEAGLPAFVDQYKKLLDDLAKASAEGVRCIMLAPVKHENLGAPLPDPTAINQELALYRDAMAKLAGERGAVFIDLFEELPKKSRKPLTDDGMHLTAGGYELLAALLLEHALGGRDDLLVPGFTKSHLVASDENLHRLQQFRELREVIMRKNELYFHRWRPQNVTYLLLFRKHEQGNNAVEIPQFDPLVAEQEKRIALLRRLDPSASREGAK